MSLRPVDEFEAALIKVEDEDDLFSENIWEFEVSSSVYERQPIENMVVRANGIAKFTVVFNKDCNKGEITATHIVVYNITKSRIETIAEVHCGFELTARNAPFTVEA